MTKRNPAAGKAGKIIYWIATVWLSLGMVSSAIVQLLKMQEEVDMFNHLGYPVYFLTVIGVWKILGVAALLIPKFALLKEWAYAGFFFTLVSALIAHIALGEGVEAWGFAAGTLVLWLGSYLLWRLRTKTALQ